MGAETVASFGATTTNMHFQTFATYVIYDKFIIKSEIKFSDRYDQALNLENSTTNHKKIEYEDLLIK